MSFHIPWPGYINLSLFHLKLFDIEHGTMSSDNTGALELQTSIFVSGPAIFQSMFCNPIFPLKRRLQLLDEATQ